MFSVISVAAFQIFLTTEHTEITEKIKAKPSLRVFLCDLGGGLIRFASAFARRQGFAILAVGGRGVKVQRSERTGGGCENFVGLAAFDQ